MLEVLKEIVGLLVSSISILTAIYKMGFKNNRKREKEYYEKLLKPFFIAYKRKQNINSVKFLKYIIERNDDSIPKYVYQLVEEEKGEELTKVLILDYSELYRNDDNTTKNILKIVFKVVIYLGVATAIFMTFWGSMYVSQGIMGVVQHFKDIVFKGEIDYLVSIVNGIIYIGFSIVLLLMTEFINQDSYTLKKKKIEKIIAKKVKLYNRNHKKIVL